MEFLFPRESLKELYPHANSGVLMFLSAECGEITYETHKINTPLRYVHFLAQMAHESGNFKYVKEIINPVKAELKYGHLSRTGKILGNTLKGDGQKYIGRGIIQLTGKWNYTRFQREMGLQIVKYPELLEVPLNATDVGFHYWSLKGLNKYADEDNLREVTRRINGGYNGIESRAYELRRLKRALGIT